LREQREQCGFVQWLQDSRRLSAHSCSRRWCESNEGESISMRGDHHACRPCLSDAAQGARFAGYLAHTRHLLIGRRALAGSFVQSGSRPHVSRSKWRAPVSRCRRTTAASCVGATVPGRRQVRQRVHRAEDPRDGLCGQETGVATAHGADKCCANRASTSRPNALVHSAHTKRAGGALADSTAAGVLSTAERGRRVAGHHQGWGAFDHMCAPRAPRRCPSARTSMVPVDCPEAVGQLVECRI
jgi:hypothetical protein